jgi:Ubiquitin carboxyl-terminal hydrolase
LKALKETGSSLAKLKKLYHIESTSINKGTSPISHQWTNLSEKKNSDPFLLLSIPDLKPGEEKVTLYDCIKHYLASQTLTSIDINKETGEKKIIHYKDPKSQLPVSDASQTVVLNQLPQYLFLRIAREKEIGNRPTFTRVKFPLENFELTTTSRKEFYNLVGFAAHSGGAKGGHWIAYTRHGENWFRCSDKLCKAISRESVTEISDNGVDSGGFLPTLFVYEKIGAPQEKKVAVLPVEKIPVPEKKKVVIEKEAKPLAKKREIKPIVIEKGLKELYKNALSGRSHVFKSLKDAAESVQRKYASIKELENKLDTAKKQKVDAQVELDAAKESESLQGDIASQAMSEMMSAEETKAKDYPEKRDLHDQAQKDMAHAIKRVNLAQSKFDNLTKEAEQLEKKISVQQTALTQARKILQIREIDYKQAAERVKKLKQGLLVQAKK